MGTFLKRPFLQVIGADQSDADLSVAAEILLARVGELVYRLVQRAPQTTVM